MIRRLSEIYNYKHPFAVCSCCGSVFEHDLKIKEVPCPNCDIILTICREKQEAINLSDAIKLLNCDENIPGNRIAVRVQ